MLLHTDVVSRKLDGEEILLHLKTGTYFGLNTTGTFLFEFLKKLDTDHSFNSEVLVKALCAEFEVDESQAHEDVSAFIKSLQENGLLAKANGV